MSVLHSVARISRVGSRDRTAQREAACARCRNAHTAHTGRWAAGALGAGRRPERPGSAACPSFWLPLRWCPSPALPAFGECPWEALLLPASVVPEWAEIRVMFAHPRARKEKPEAGNVCTVPTLGLEEREGAEWQSQQRSLASADPPW